MKQLYLIIPVYNGAQYIETTVRELERFFSHKDITIDIVWVDDGSNDDTLMTIQQAISESDMSMSVLSYENNKGKGHAIQYALAHRDGEYAYIGFTDVELPYGLQVVSDAIIYMDVHPDRDMVVGSRYQAHTSVTQYHWYRRIAHALFRMFIPGSVRHFKDTQCGFKLFRQHVVDTIFSRIKTFRWVFDIELFVVAMIHQINIYEIPVIIKPNCVKKKGGVSLIRHGCSVMHDLFVIWRVIIQKKYE